MSETQAEREAAKRKKPLFSYLSLGAGVQSTTLLLMVINRDQRLLDWCEAEGEPWPEYAIFAWSGIGHHLHYVARRATVADNFGPVTGLDDENFRLSDQLFRYRVPARALRTLRRLGTCTVPRNSGGASGSSGVTGAEGERGIVSMWQRLRSRNAHERSNHHVRGLSRERHPRKHTLAPAATGGSFGAGRR